MRISSGVDFWFVSPEISLISTGSFDRVENSNPCKKVGLVTSQATRARLGLASKKARLELSSLAKRAELEP